MPELSVVVHGPDPQDHLTGLLGSLAAHPAPETEIVVAAVGDWAREAAERHAPACQVVPLPDGTGAAAARAAVCSATVRGAPAGSPSLAATKCSQRPVARA
ncbi:CDP-glycerol--poly(glycerophosphate) glycerophosphotransferase, partial [Streptomyces sp. NPDC023723]